MNELAAVREEALGKVAEAEDLATLESLRVAYLGKKGALTGVLKSLGKLPPEERPAAGAAVNAAKEEMQAALEARREALQGAALEAQLAAEAVDITLPGRQGSRGGRHPHAVTMARIVEIFRQAGYAVASGPEVESDYYNFEALNIPTLQARAMHDTFYLEGREEQATGDPLAAAPAHPHLPGAGAHHGEHPAADSDHLPGQGLPSRFGCDPYPHVSPGGRLGSGGRRQHGSPEGNGDRIPPSFLRRR